MFSPTQQLYLHDLLIFCDIFTRHTFIFCPCGGGIVWRWYFLHMLEKAMLKCDLCSGPVYSISNLRIRHYGSDAENPPCLDGLSSMEFPL